MVVKNLSRLRSKERFTDTPDYTSEDAWFRAKKSQDHLFECGHNLYVFPNARYFNDGHEEITKALIDAHVKAFRCFTFENFLKKRLFYILDYNHESCECRDFHHYAYCKHLLAVKIALEELEVLIYLTLI